MKGPNSGKLIIHIIEADFKKDTDTFGKMDPFCKMIYNGKTFKTAAKNGAGMKPKWN